MSDITRGHTFVGGEVVEAQSLNDLVSNAVVQPTLISEKVLKDPAAMGDRLLIEDSGALKGITIQQIIDLVTPKIVNAAVPIGTVADFAGPNAPTGWLLCQGQTVDRDEFADLFLQIGTIYGAGDGTTTFGLPDCRGKVVAALDAGAGLVGDPAVNIGLNGNVMGSTGGRHVNVLTVNEMPVHTHPPSFNFYSTTQEGGSNYGLVAGGPFTGRVLVSSSTASFSVGTQGGGAAHNNVQPTIMMQKIIKALNL